MTRTRSAIAVVGLVVTACAGADADDAGASETAAEGSSGAATDSPVTTVDDTSAGSADSGTMGTRPDYVQDIAPLVATHCLACHVAGGIAPFALDTYEDAEVWSAASAIQVMNGLMPPWHAVETDECTPPLPFKHDARLTDDEKQVFIDWATAGAPHGDPALAAPLPPAPSLDLTDPTATATMASAIDLPADGPTRDFFHCVSLDPGNTEDVYIDGMQVLPGNAEVVHHVLMFVDEGAASADWDGGVRENCGGGSGVGGALLVGGWVPGSMPIVTPDDVAIRLPAGARLIFNMHYHNGTGAMQTDTGTGVALRWSSTLPRYVGSFQLIGAPGAGNLLEPPFLIPADATGHIERVRFTVPNLGVPEIRLFSMTNHMHKVGVDMRASIIRGGAEACMLQTPRWDFAWQRSYLYGAPVEELPEVLPGDIVEVRCTYDNTLANPGVAQMLAEVGLDAPQDVTLGEGTLDEMCLAGVGVAVRPF